MNALLKGLEARGEPSPDDTDIGTQLLRVMREHPGISRDRVLSEIGILFVEGFETTGRQMPRCSRQCWVWVCFLQQRWGKIRPGLSHGQCRQRCCTHTPAGVCWCK